MQTVIGLFKNAEQAKKAAEELISSGFSQDDIEVSVDGNSVSSSSYNNNAKGENYDQDPGNGESANGMAKGATTGMEDNTYTGTTAGYPSENTGGDLTGTRDTLSPDYRSSSDDSSTPHVDGDYPLSTGSSAKADSGDISSNTSSHIGDGDNDNNSFGDRISRFFTNLFGGDDDADAANRYAHVARTTGCMVTVYAETEDRAEEAADILDDYDAIDVDREAAEYGYNASSMGTGSRMDTPTAILGTGSADYDTTGNTNYAAENIGSTGTTADSLNVIKEDIEISKREVETGGVRLRSRIVERPVEKTLRLREEKVTVERVPVDRPASAADFQNFKEGEIEMIEYAEVADITKAARVVEEVKLNKEVNERSETINETARNTEVDMENVSKKV